jgi:hypothetical protein
MAPKPHSPSDEELSLLLGDVMADIEAIIEAVLAGSADTDLMIADAVEGQPELVRIAIVEKIRAAVRERSEEKAKALDAALEQQKLLEHTRQKRQWREMLAYVMSQETLRKIKEAMLSSPSVKREVEHAWQDLAKKGVLQQLQGEQAGQLGGLSANVAQSKENRQGKDVGR